MSAVRVVTRKAAESMAKSAASGIVVNSPSSSPPSPSPSSTSPPSPPSNAFTTVYSPLSERFRGRGGDEVRVTDTARHRLRELVEMARAEDDAAGQLPVVGLRLGLRKAGCGGSSFTLEYLRRPPGAPDPLHAERDATVLEVDGLRVVLASRALFPVPGT